MQLIFKIVPKAMWDEAIAAGNFDGAPVDLADGFIHFSDAAQVHETAAKHFRGQEDLLLVAFDAEAFGEALKWEVSRGGALFPHLYAELSPQIALWTKPLPVDDQGTHVFPDLTR